MLNAISNKLRSVPSPGNKRRGKLSSRSGSEDSTPPDSPRVTKSPREGSRVEQLRKPRKSELGRSQSVKSPRRSSVDPPAIHIETSTPPHYRKLFKSLDALALDNALLTPPDVWDKLARSMPASPADRSPVITGKHRPRSGSWKGLIRPRPKRSKSPDPRSQMSPRARGSVLLWSPLEVADLEPGSENWIMADDINSDAEFEVRFHDDVMVQGWV